MRLLGPSTLIITFQKTGLKEVLQNTCVYLSVHLTGSHQGSEDTTSPHEPAWPGILL